VFRDTDDERLSMAPAATDTLTAREIEVLRLVADGFGNRAIGERLGITASTVKHHLATIFTKLDVRRRAEAVREGVKRGLIPL